MSTFKAGDLVTWTSQAGGHTRIKTGKVIAVIDGGHKSGETAASEIKKRVRAGTHRSAFGGGWDRAETSYLVEVANGKSGRAKPTIYWPVASKLKPV
ncbi:hypothetical protein [Thermomonas mangrovi]|uniref:hypothetical protein n=1 Tax=Thermomonas mangrovi TaxID=2993316 RepID=UPI002307D2AB|nr:hypothetical protein [Thermomonas mangrovi]